MSIFISIFDRFGFDFGCLWEVMLGSFGRLGRPKLVPKPSSNRLIFEKVFIQKNECHCSHSTILRPKLAQDRPKITPRSLQDGSKIVLDRFFSS